MFPRDDLYLNQVRRTNKEKKPLKKPAIDHPPLMEVWDWEKNVDIDPNIIGFRSTYKCHFKCKVGHEWVGTPHKFARTNKCPYCRKRMASPEYNLAVLFPHLKLEWDYHKNDRLPEEYLVQSNTRVFWICKNGHEWKTSIHNRTLRGDGCVKCSKRKASFEYNLFRTCPHISLFWDFVKNKQKIEDFTSGSKHVAYFRCRYGHTWTSPIVDRVKCGDYCPQCPTPQRSRGEAKITRYLLSRGFSYTREKSFKKELGRLEFDFYLPYLGNEIFIEFQGPHHYMPATWFKSENADKMFETIKKNDQRKRDFVKSRGAILLEIKYTSFEDVELILDEFFNNLSANNEVLQ